MKVIKDGKFGDSRKWETKVECLKSNNSDKWNHETKNDIDGCGAVMEKISARDLILLYWVRAHVRHYYSAIKCPQCGRYIEVVNVPNPIFEKMNKKKATSNGYIDNGSDFY